MPLLRIVSDSSLSRHAVIQVKAFGNIIGYNDPRCIWVEVNDSLTQSDVVVVTVTCEQKDFDHKEFKSFCIAIGTFLQKATNKSVEVVRPIDGGIESIHWSPTDEGASIYGGGQ